MQWASVLYPNHEGAKFDFEYYMSKHVPMVAGLLKTKIEICRGIASTTGPSAPFVCSARIQIKSADEFFAAMATYGAQIMSDIPNYTNIQPIVQIDELVPDGSVNSAA